jgi:hypothetical protein
MDNSYRRILAPFEIRKAGKIFIFLGGRTAHHARSCWDYTIKISKNETAKIQRTLYMHGNTIVHWAFRIIVHPHSSSENLRQIMECSYIFTAFSFEFLTNFIIGI